MPFWMRLKVCALRARSLFPSVSLCLCGLPSTELLPIFPSPVESYQGDRMRGFMRATPLLLRRREAYRRTFLGADGRPHRNAERVLAALRRFCRATAPSFTPGDPHTTALLEGRIALLHLAHHGRDFLDILRPEVEGGLHLAGISMADFDRVLVGRSHSELGEVNSRRPFATVIGAGGEANRREKQAHKIAHLSH